MNKLSKILRVGALALGSLSGCTNNYNINGEVLKYNSHISNQLTVQRKDEMVKYYLPSKGKSSKATGKDIIMIVKYKRNEIVPRYLSDFNKEDSSEFKEEVKKFDGYLNKMDSVDNLNRLNRGLIRPNGEK